MKEILREKFETEKIEGEDYIIWKDERITRSKLDFVANSFSVFEKGKMLEESPTTGWKETIERWGELGKFD